VRGTRRLPCSLIQKPWLMSVRGVPP